MSRWLPLYLRSRRVPLALVVSAGAVTVLAGSWSAATDGREPNLSLTVLAVALALAPLIPTLAGDDDALESTAALRWPPRRALHLIACFALATAALAWFAPAWQVVRASAGLTGLIGLGAALLGTRMAWQLPVCWTALQVVAAGDNGVLFWLVQPADSRPAATTAALLFLAGLIAYATRPAPRTAPAEATMGQ